MGTRAVVPARVSLTILAAGAVLLLPALPRESHLTGQMYPEVSHLVIPYAVAADLTVLSGLVVLLALWRLLALAAGDRAFTSASLTWLHVLRLAIALMAAFPVIVALHLLVVVSLGGPGVVLALGAGVAGGAAGFFVVTVMREVVRAEVVARRP
ncbi:DUF2975 domain-containing protein [Brachybacterium sp. GCM10030267]|uniref:DUF2975 domain-containing protein n=1 Tax=Brachybacterium sp. GCM10030267 TaxID=3273381 RepID=UPI00361ADDF1